MVYRRQIPFSLSIREKILIPFVLIAAFVTLAGVEIVGGLLREQIREHDTGFMESSSRAVGEMAAARMEELVDLAMIIGATSSAGGKDVFPLGPRVLGYLEENGVGLEVRKAVEGRPGETVIGRREGVSFGFRTGEGEGGVALFARMPRPCPGVREEICLHGSLGAAFLEKVRMQTGFDVALYSTARSFIGGTVGEGVMAAVFPDGLPRPPEERGGKMSGQSPGRDPYYLYHFFPLKVEGVPVAYGVLVSPTGELARRQRFITMEIFLVATVIGGLCILLYIWLVGRITRPINQLMEGVERVGRGDYSVGPEIQSRDEIGRLASAFRNMTYSLRRHRRELQEATHKIIHQDRLAAVGQMVSGIVHEIKNPLNSLGILIRLAKGEEDEVERASYLDRMADEVKRMGDSVGWFLNLSRRPSFSLGPVDVNERIKALLGRMESMFTGRGVEVKTSLAPDLPSLVLDAGQLDQVLYNLSYNSLQAMPQGGVLTVATGVADAGAQGPGEPRRLVRITIADTGVGIPPEDLGKVFEPFFTSKSPGEGTGLGLSIVRSAVEEYGGRVRLTSAPGEGTTAEVLLPVPDR